MGELLDTVASDAHTSKKRKLEISHISALPTADEAFEMLTGHDEEEEGTGDGNLLEKLDAIGGDEGEGVPGREKKTKPGWRRKKRMRRTMTRMQGIMMRRITLTMVMKWARTTATTAMERARSSRSGSK